MRGGMKSPVQGDLASHDSEVVLDLKGLLCPLPVLKARKRLEGMASGEILTVLATDPMAAIDVPHFCHEQGHQLLAHSQEGEVLAFTIKRR